MKYIVWLRDDGTWAPNGDGPMTRRDADRVAREIRKDFGIATRVLPPEMDPNDKPNHEHRSDNE